MPSCRHMRMRLCQAVAGSGWIYRFQRLFNVGDCSQEVAIFPSCTLLLQHTDTTCANTVFTCDIYSVCLKAPSLPLSDDGALLRYSQYHNPCYSWELECRNELWVSITHVERQQQTGEFALSSQPHFHICFALFCLLFPSFPPFPNWEHYLEVKRGAELRPELPMSSSSPGAAQTLWEPSLYQTSHRTGSHF